MSSTHYVRCRGRYDHNTQTEVREWTCVSEWDGPSTGRLRNPMHRATTYHNERDAQRWARKYGVDCPVVPEPR